MGCLGLGGNDNDEDFIMINLVVNYGTYLLNVE